MRVITHIIIYILIQFVIVVIKAMIKKIRLAISDKPLSLVVSITSPTSNTNNIQNNNDYVIKSMI